MYLTATQLTQNCDFEPEAPMSWFKDNDPVPGDPQSCDVIEQVIIPRARDLGGFEVRRALPAVARQMIGPFIFFDQMGPAQFISGQGIDVRPHPHIGLATVTYLFEGEIMHRDSLGTSLAIQPGAVNLMTAGRGIVHSERTAPEMRASGQRLFGIQSWMALPKSQEEAAPDFVHFGVEDLPRIEGEGKRVRLVLGALYGATSPAELPHESFYAEAVLAPGAVLPLDPTHEERAVYIASGRIDIAGQSFEGGQLLVFRPGDRISILAETNARLMLLGGEPMDGPRHIWWNFVSSSKERIEQAKSEWRNGRFEIVPGDAEEFIPLPGES
jgi:redox-sensitive bicupin YhaK (pirin superfamily)